jgi:PAS domain S-box-containing protein
MMTQAGATGDTGMNVEELKRRLDEAEETLRAIRDGEVDALLVRNERMGDEVFTLEGDASYHAFMEAMELGAAAFDEANRLLYANKAVRQLLRLTEEGVDATHFWAALNEEPRAAVLALMGEARQTKTSGEIRAILGNEELHLLVSAAPLQLGANRGVAVTFTDITSKVRAAAAEASERAAHSIIASANEAVVVCDVNGVVTHANAAVASICSGNPVGRLFGEVIPLTLPDTTGLLQADDIIALASSGNSVQGIEAIAPDAPRVKDLLLSAAPLRVGSDQVSGCVITMVDLSQRKAAEKQQLLLMGELDHRVKNTLALVLSICKRTASTEESVPAFQAAFSGRIQALAATHNLLADRSWSSISISEVISAELEPFLGMAQSRLSVTGVDALMLPRAAIALGLIIHELATNAVKYGSLSNGIGRVMVSVTKDADTPYLAVEWKEDGGPIVRQPTKRGFGQTVITRSLQYMPAGGADIEYLPEGVRCLIRVPDEDVVKA